MPHAEDLSRSLQILYAAPAEARLALQLHEGHSLASTAQLNDVSIGTVRMQLKAVFRKTGVGRQIDLQRLLHALSGQ